MQNTPFSLAAIPFQKTGPTVALAMTTTTASTAFDTTTTSQVQLFNNSASPAFVEFTNVSGVASSASYPMAPGAVVVVSVPAATYVAALLLSGTGTLYITPGQGE